MPRLKCPADALAGEEVQKVIHPQLISGPGELWKTSSPLFLVTALAENIPRTLFKDTGLINHYAELLKMKAKLLVLEGGS